MNNKGADQTAGISFVSINLVRLNMTNSAINNWILYFNCVEI